MNLSIVIKWVHFLFVFLGRKRIQTFGMMKYLTKHIWDPAEIE